MGVYTEDIFIKLKQYFGYSEFRPQQQEIIESVLEGKDSMVIMPTGGGKSICFQLPAVVMGKLCLVISPLIALMKDQVDGLVANGISAAYYNSSLSSAENTEVIRTIENGELSLLYVAPESLGLLDNVLANEELGLIAIDEAHCISSWGHDFRPAYTNLGFLKKKYPNVPLIALTATADKATRNDIKKQLRISESKTYISSFDRKNFFLEIRGGQNRMPQIIDYISENKGESGIIYCLSRKSTEQIAMKLKAKGFEAEAYHAGLSTDKRSDIQERFIKDELGIVCATIAFGMGIDKSNIRWVIHYNIPKNIEGYYQEIGRAGRDSLPATAIMFYSYADVIMLQKFINDSANKEVQQAKLDRMMQFVQASSCRRKTLLSYFGEILEDDCGSCDVCKNPPQHFEGTVLAQKILSTVYRARENVAINSVVDILKGSKNQNVMENGYNTIKTYGIVTEYNWNDLQQYVVQMVNMGYLEVAFDQGNSLKLNKLSEKVLFEKHKVYMAEISKIEKHKEAIKEKNNNVSSDLFDRLRRLRLKLSQEKGVPAYLIFSDAALKDMEQKCPTNQGEFSEISGVGARKSDEFYKAFTDEILKYKSEGNKLNKPKQARAKAKPKTKKAKTDKRPTHEITYELIQNGFSVKEISDKREFTESTIYNHITKLHNASYDVDIYQYIDKITIEKMKLAKVKLENSRTIKDYYEYFDGDISYNHIRMALALI
ncbi:MAG: DNA helicase RecQ [Flavobacteriaceae bacterium]|nr:DNA helicase RecQ [Flavobacteriaceae bacterium]